MTSSVGHSWPLTASDATSRSGRGCAVAAWMLAAVLVLVGVGWFCHTSPNPRVLGKYSPAWAAFLVFVVAGEAVALAGLYAWRRRMPALFRRLAFAGAVVVLMLALVGLPAYILAHHRYLSRTVFRPMWNREHPFLQWDQPLAAEPVVPKPPGVVRVVCMGGSTTQGYRVAAVESYPGILQTLLDEQFGPGRFEVLNAGSCWHTTQHTLIKYLSRICDYEPDVIIEMHAWNDMYQCGERVFARGEFRPDYGHFMGALTPRLRPHDNLAERVWRNPFFDNLYSDFRRGDARPRRSAPVDPAVALPSFRRNLRHMADICAADRVRLVLASQPFLYKQDMSNEELAVLTYDHLLTADELPSLAAILDAMDAFNTATREVAAERGVAFIDLEPVLPKNLGHFIDDVHWTPDGSRIIAQAVFDAVDWLRLLPGVKSDTSMR